MAQRRHARRDLPARRPDARRRPRASIYAARRAERRVLLLSVRRRVEATLWKTDGIGAGTTAVGPMPSFMRHERRARRRDPLRRLRPDRTGPSSGERTGRPRGPPCSSTSIRPAARSRSSSLAWETGSSSGPTTAYTAASPGSATGRPRGPTLLKDINPGPAESLGLALDAPGLDALSSGPTTAFMDSSRGRPTGPPPGPSSCATSRRVLRGSMLIETLRGRRATRSSSPPRTTSRDASSGEATGQQAGTTPGRRPRSRARGRRHVVLGGPEPQRPRPLRRPGLLHRDRRHDRPRALEPSRSRSASTPSPRAASPTRAIRTVRRAVSRSAPPRRSSSPSPAAAASRRQRSPSPRTSRSSRRRRRGASPSSPAARPSRGRRRCR